MATPKLPDIFEGASKTKTNHNLVAVMYGSVIAAMVIVFLLSDPVRLILETILVVCLVALIFKTPDIMRKMPASETLQQAALHAGYQIEMDGKMSPLPPTSPTLPPGGRWMKQLPSAEHPPNQDNCEQGQDTSAE